MRRGGIGGAARARRTHEAQRGTQGRSDCQLRIDAGQDRAPMADRRRQPPHGARRTPIIRSSGGRGGRSGRRAGPCEPSAARRRRSPSRLFDLRDHGSHAPPSSPLATSEGAHGMYANSPPANAMVGGVRAAMVAPGPCAAGLRVVERARRRPQPTRRRGGRAHATRSAYQRPYPRLAQYTWHVYAQSARIGPKAHEQSLQGRANSNCWALCEEGFARRQAAEAEARVAGTHFVYRSSQYAGLPYCAIVPVLESCAGLSRQSGPCLPASRAGLRSSAS